MDKETVNKIKYYINKKKTVKEISGDLNIPTYSVYGIVQELINEGFLYDIVDGEIIKLNKPKQNTDVYEISNKLSKLKMLLISDTHLCSKYDRLDILRYLYNKAEDSEVKYVLHSGDFTDGKSTRPEHIYELRELSYEGQVEYCVEKYPQFSGKTYVISGNHDDWWVKSTGSEIVKSISKQRDDIIYLGADIADMKIGKLKIQLFHGKGGSAYAKSYKIQKYLDSTPIKDRPNILQTGHIHQSFFYQQDNTTVFQTGCLEDPTPYIRSLGFIGDKSCWWVDVTFDDEGNVTEVIPKLETFGKKLIRR